MDFYRYGYLGGCMKFKLLVLSMLAVSSLPAFASDGDITFIGVVTASACALNGFNGGTTKAGRQ